MKTIDDCSTASCSFLVHLYFTNSYWYNWLAYNSKQGPKAMGECIKECQRYVTSSSVFKLDKADLFHICYIFNQNLLPSKSHSPLKYPNTKLISKGFDLFS